MTAFTPDTNTQLVNEGIRAAQELRAEADRLLSIARSLEAAYGIKHTNLEEIPIAFASIRKGKKKPGK